MFFEENQGYNLVKNSIPYGYTKSRNAELSAEFNQLLEQKQEDIVALKESRAEVSNLWHIKTNLDILTDDDYPEKKLAQRTKEDVR